MTGAIQGNDPRLDRREAMRVLLDRRGDMLLVTGLGSTTWDAAAVGDDVRNFYLWGAMGAAAMVGLGLAIAQPERRVLVVTGDVSPALTSTPPPPLIKLKDVSPVGATLIAAATVMVPVCAASPIVSVGTL